MPNNKNNKSNINNITTQKLTDGNSGVSVEDDHVLIRDDGLRVGIKEWCTSIYNIRVNISKLNADRNSKTLKSFFGSPP